MAGDASCRPFKKGMDDISQASQKREHAQCCVVQDFLFVQQRLAYQDTHNRFIVSCNISILFKSQLFDSLSDSQSTQGQTSLTHTPSLACPICQPPFHHGMHSAIANKSAHTINSGNKVTEIQH
eukprot:1161745-Pelagomonas_calceolata.AAC.18